MFQSTVRYDQGSGIPGEIAYDGPHRAEPGILAASGTVGNVFSENPANPGFWSPGTQANAVRFALLTTPKQYAAFGTQAGGPLAPTMVLPANAEGEFTSMGQIFVLSSNAGGASASKPGDLVYFNNTTGLIVTAAPGAAAPATSTLLPGAVVAPLPGGNRGLTPVTPSLIVVTLNGPFGFPPAAP